MIIIVIRSFTVMTAPGSSRWIVPVPGCESACTNVYLSVELELAGLHLLERLDHQRNLDRAHRLHLPVGVDRDFLARLERLHVDAPGGVDAAGRRFDRRLQALEWGRGRLQRGDDAQTRRQT